MRKKSLLIVLLCVLVVPCSLQYSQSRLKIGLMRFSRSVFHQEKGRLGEIYTNIEGIIQKKLNTARYFNDKEISFSEIEDPENIIDNSMTWDTNQKLEHLCRSNGLDGIIFGHIEQEAKMMLVFRFYYSQSLAEQRGISQKHRIKSFYREIDNAYLTPIKVKQVTHELMNKLDTVINRDRVLIKVPPQPEPTKKPIPITPPQKKVKKIPGFDDLPPPPEKIRIARIPGEPSGIAGVYQMVMAYGFYCDLDSSKDHTNALLGLQVKKGIIFKEDADYFARKIKTAPEPGKPDIIETMSQHVTDKTDVIKLQWANHRMRKLTYQETRQHIEKLNEMNYAGFNDWRIPTIKELFSVIEHTDRHYLFFPFNFNEYDLDGQSIPTDINIWSSTLVNREEKDLLSMVCNKHNAYFIIKKREDTLGFHISCEIYHQYVIPVRSPTGKAVILPEKKEKLAPLYATQLGFIDKSLEPVKGFAKKELDFICDKVSEEIIKQLTKFQRRWRKELIINKEGHRIPNTPEHAGELIEIAFDRFVPKERRLEKIIEKKMRPYKADVIITGQYVVKKGDIYEIRPIVILKSGIVTKNFILDRKQLILRVSQQFRIKLRKGAKKIFEEKVRELFSDFNR